MRVFKKHESAVRSYCRAFPVVFDRASGCFLYDRKGREYLDFFAGAGSLNYGHNHPVMKNAVIEYMKRDGILQGLDMATVAKERFLSDFQSVILRPRGYKYKVQFSGPTGTNAVESALKLARVVKKRSNIIAFTNAFHGLSLGALAVTSNSYYRNEAFINRTDVSFLPYCGYYGPGVDTIKLLRKTLEDCSSGVDLPAAIILEIIQAEGGVNIASVEWLQELEALCRRFDILMVVDDIQTGCGRAGSFFSFERAGIRPDIVTLSKSISGFGFPMSIVLLKPELDIWKPGEHTGTFRGNNLAFVTAVEALKYWKTDEFSRQVIRKGRLLIAGLKDVCRKFPALALKVRGTGMICGLEFPDPDISKSVAYEAFRRGLVIELCGSRGQVLKFLPPLVAEDELLKRGIGIVKDSIEAVARATGELKYHKPKIVR
jgi:diaminobutyrate-2-oxoglutarate transaminase